MKSLTIILPAMVLGLAVGCASPQDKAYKAQESVHKERLKLINEYQKCLKKAGDDKKAIEACDSYLKAAEALK